MGCTQGICGSIKPKSNALIIKRPEQQHFSLELSESEIIDAVITIPPKDCVLGVPFIIQELEKVLLPTQMKNTIKPSRMNKWKKMVSYGLDEDLQHKVFKVVNNGPRGPIIFSKKRFLILGKIAKIGLTNFYEAFPELFKKRLSKGPPPQYRWLAWQVVARKKLKKVKGIYENLLKKEPDP
jgi:hypothetical protein